MKHSNKLRRIARTIAKQAAKLDDIFDASPAPYHERDAKAIIYAATRILEREADLIDGWEAVNA